MTFRERIANLFKMFEIYEDEEESEALADLVVAIADKYYEGKPHKNDRYKQN